MTSPMIVVDPQPRGLDEIFDAPTRARFERLGELVVHDGAGRMPAEIVERHIAPEELAGFSECFITGTAAEVTPVAQIGEHTFKPGNISLSLMDDFAKMVRRQLVAA